MVAINKTASIHSTIDEQNLDIMAGTETYLKSNHPAAIRNDSARWIYRSSFVSSSRFKDKGWWNHADFKGIITSAYHEAGGKIHVVQGFGSPDDRLNRPPQHLHYQSATADSRILRRRVPCLLDEVISIPGSFNICGDFNCRRSVWAN